MMSAIPHTAPDKQGTQESLSHQAKTAVIRKLGRRRSIECLPHFISRGEVRLTPNQRRQTEQLVKVTHAAEPILVRPQLVCSVCVQLPRSAQEELWDARLVVTESGATVRLQIRGAPLADWANHSEICIGQGKPVTGARRGIDPGGAKARDLTSARHERAVKLV